MHGNVQKSVLGFFIYLDDFDIWQAVKERLEINAIQHNAIVENMSVGLEVNHCLFLENIKADVKRNCNMRDCNMERNVPPLFHDAILKILQLFQEFIYIVLP